MAQAVICQQLIMQASGQSRTVNVEISPISKEMGLIHFRVLLSSTVSINQCSTLLFIYQHYIILETDSTIT